MTLEGVGPPSGGGADLGTGGAAIRPDADPAIGRSVGAPYAVRPNKLRTPCSAEVVARTRLFARLDALDRYPMVSVADAPGSGKTTLVASYLAARRLPHLWLLLDRRDAELETFLHYLGLAAIALEPRCRNRLPEFAPEDRGDIDGFARRLWGAMVTHLGERWCLVLDNVHDLADDSPVHRVLRAAADELPDGVRLFMIGLSAPGPAYASAVAKRRLVRLERGALRFTTEELRALLAEHGREAETATFLRLTDGWVAGAFLLLASAPRGDPVPMGVDGAGVQAVFDYFASEVFERIRVRRRQALLRVALLPHASTSMARAIGGPVHAVATLEALFRRNLFVDRRSGSEPVYTFHALFRRFLLERVKREVPPEELARLERTAAVLLEKDAQVDAALELLLDSGAVGEAQALLFRHAADYVAEGRFRALLGWLRALPRDRHDVAEHLYWSACCTSADDAATAETLFERAFARFTERGDVEGQLLAAAGAAEAVVSQGHDLRRLDRWLDLFESAPRTWLDGLDSSRERRALPGMLAAFVARRPHRAMTERLAERAERLLEREPAARQTLLFGALAAALVDQGQHQRMSRLVHRVEALRGALHVAPATEVRWLHALAFWKTLTGKLEEAVADARDAEALCVAPALQGLRGQTRLAAAQAAWAVGDTCSAHGHLRAARVLLDARRRVDHSVLAFVTGAVALHEGEPHAAVTSLDEAVRLAREGGSPGRERVALFVLCLALSECGELERAETTLREATAHPSYRTSHFHRWVVATIEANLADRLGDTPRCVVALRRALGIARAEGFDWAPGLFATGIMPRICALALEHDIDRGLVQRWIRERALRPPSLACEHWPWAVRVESLGRWQLQSEHAPQALSRKPPRKPLELLKLLIAAGGQADAAALAQTLWPDALGDAARRSFEDTLHRLRRLLGVDAAVLLHQNKLSLSPDLVWCDVRALEHLLDEFTMLAAVTRGDASDAAWIDLRLAALTDRILGLYRGPFLPEEEEFPSILSSRARLRARVLRQLAQLGERLERRGDPLGAVELYRRILEQDALAEHVCRRLMRCYLSLGRRAEAFDAYRTCRHHLSILLGVEPSAETRALAERLGGGRERPPQLAR